MKFSLPASVLFLSVLFLAYPQAVFAGKKEANQKIEALNHQIKAAGEKGDLQAAIEAAEQVYDISKKEFGEQSLEYSKAMNNMANLYMYANHAEDAERFYKQAIVIEADKKGSDSLDLAGSYYNLAMAYAMQKKYDEARKMLTKCHAIRAKNLGAENPETKKAQEALDQIWNQHE